MGNLPPCLSLTMQHCCSAGTQRGVVPKNAAAGERGEEVEAFRQVRASGAARPPGSTRPLVAEVYARAHPNLLLLPQQWVRRPPGRWRAKPALAGLLATRSRTTPWHDVLCKPLPTRRHAGSNPLRTDFHPECHLVIGPALTGPSHHPAAARLMCMLSTRHRSYRFATRRQHRRRWRRWRWWRRRSA